MQMAGLGFKAIKVGCCFIRAASLFIYSIFFLIFFFVVLNLVLELKLVFPPFHAHAHPNNFATVSYFLGSIIGHFLGNK